MNENNRPFYKYDEERRIDFWEFMGVDLDDEPKCGVYWIITTCLTGIAIGIWLGMVLWLISGEHR